MPTALILGHGPGLGAATARRLAADGFTVALARRDAAEAQADADALGGRAYSIDAADDASLLAGIDAVEADLGPLHTVVWNVGAGVFGTLDQVDVDGFDRAVDTNARGLFVLAKRVLPAMAARGEGNLILTGATASTRGRPFTVAFAPGKMAQRGLAEALARTYWKQGVHVALILVDGMVDLPTTRARMPDKGDEAFVSPDGFAHAVSFLVGQPRGAWTFELDVRPHVENW